MKEYLAFADELADASRAMLIEAARLSFTGEKKTDGSPVTSVDQAVEARLREMIADAYPDHGMMYLFLPRSVQVTDMEILWLVRDDAREGDDYDRDRLTWMWDVTSIADKRIIDNNQKGVNSRFYAPGPYQEMETPVAEFIVWYLEELGAGG